MNEQNCPTKHARCKYGMPKLPKKSTTNPLEANMARQSRQIKRKTRRPMWKPKVDKTKQKHFLFPIIRCALHYEPPVQTKQKSLKNKIFENKLGATPKQQATHRKHLNKQQTWAPVMEHGIKSPSLKRRSRGRRATSGPNAN